MSWYIKHICGKEEHSWQRNGASNFMVDGGSAPVEETIRVFNDV